MKRITFIVACVFLAAFSSCQKDKEIGAPINIKPDYVLPQTGASASANARIQAIFDKYDSFILYDFTQRDALWEQSTGSPGITNYEITPGDLQNVDAMLDFIEEAWLDHYPDDFLKEVGLPYRVFIGDEIIQDRSTPTSPFFIYYDFKLTGKSFALARMNDIPTMTGEEKTALKNSWFVSMWSYYSNYLTVPDEFYNVSNYITAPTLPLYIAANLEAYRQRGFLPSNYTNYGMDEWYNYAASSWENARANDLASFLYHLTRRTDEQMAAYLDNPDYSLIREKWEILKKHYKDVHGIDVRAIVNQTF